MLAMAWTHAKSFVTDHISLLVTLPENRHQFVEVNIHDRLSLADGIVLVHYLGLTRAAQFIFLVDPWLYPNEEDAPGPLCLPFTQSVVNKATDVGKLFSKFTEESKSSYLASPLLLRKGDRPDLIRVSKAALQAPGGSCIAAARCVTVTGVFRVLPIELSPMVQTDGNSSFLSPFPCLNLR
jgi:hypothetical protein